jgi:hypothetical protein
VFKMTFTPRKAKYNRFEYEYKPTKRAADQLKKRFENQGYHVTVDTEEDRGKIRYTITKWWNGDRPTSKPPKTKTPVSVSSEKIVLVKGASPKLTSGRKVKIRTPGGMSLGGGVVRDRRGQHIRM